MILFQAQRRLLLIRTEVSMAVSLVGWACSTRTGSLSLDSFVEVLHSDVSWIEWDFKTRPHSEHIVSPVEWSNTASVTRKSKTILFKGKLGCSYFLFSALGFFSALISTVTPEQDAFQHFFRSKITVEEISSGFPSEKFMKVFGILLLLLRNSEFLKSEIQIYFPRVLHLTHHLW